MKAVVQLVHEATLFCEQKEISHIEKGMIVMVGIGDQDREDDVFLLAEKLVKTRMFKDDNHKINLNLSDISGQVLLVSNFTLQADLSHGNRPNFSHSAGYDSALRLFDMLADQLTLLKVQTVKKGVFGQHMDITVSLNGPITMVFDTKDSNF